MLVKLEVRNADLVTTRNHLSKIISKIDSTAAEKSVLERGKY
jgi:hypothetical protein